MRVQVLVDNGHCLLYGRAPLLVPYFSSWLWSLSQGQLDTPYCSAPFTLQFVSYLTLVVVNYKSPYYASIVYGCRFGGMTCSISSDAYPSYGQVRGVWSDGMPRQLIHRSIIQVTCTRHVNTGRLSGENEKEKRVGWVGSFCCADISYWSG